MYCLYLVWQEAVEIVESVEANNAGWGHSNILLLPEDRDSQITTAMPYDISDISLMRRWGSSPNLTGVASPTRASAAKPIVGPNPSHHTRLDRAVIGL